MEEVVVEEEEEEEKEEECGVGGKGGFGGRLVKPGYGIPIG